MVTPELLEYIRTQYMAGVSRTDIANALIQSGWVAFDAEEALAQVVAAPTAPPQMQAPPATETSIAALPQSIVSSMPTASSAALPVFGASTQEFSQPTQSRGGHVLKFLLGTVLAIVLIIAVDIGAGYYYDIISFPITLPYSLPFSIPGILESSLSATLTPETTPIKSATTTPETTPVPVMASTTASSTQRLLPGATTTEKTTATTTGTKATTTVKVFIGPQPPQPPLK